MKPYSEAYQKAIGRSDQGDGTDFWATPPQATQALLDVEFFGGSILEPACGLGDMSKVIREHYQHYQESSLLSADLIDRGWSGQDRTVDFLTLGSINHFGFDNVITNPPFNLALPFIEKALKVARNKVAMLLPLEFLQSQKRLNFFRNSPLVRVYVFPWRVPFWQPGYDKPMNNRRHAWYVWCDHEYAGQTVLEWFDLPVDGVDREWFKNGN